jgi:hypothetical protein
MSEKDTSYSESGTPIYRYNEPKKDFELAIGESESLEQIGKHIAKHIGEAATVYHEIISDQVHVDIHVIAPTRQRNYYTLVTSGMSDKPMAAPEQMKDCGYSELLMCLPASWPLVEESLKDENNYWPIRWLKILARFPHEFDTWIWLHHTLPNGDPPVPYAANTRFCCAMLSFPILFGEDFYKLRINDDKTIHFHSFLPLYREEMEFKLKHGFDSFLDRMKDIEISELLDLKRKNAVKKRLFWPFR